MSKNKNEEIKSEKVVEKAVEKEDITEIKEISRKPTDIDGVELIKYNNGTMKAVQAGAV